MSDWTGIITEILRREGWPKYTNLPADRGGPTKGGITLNTWRSFTGNPTATAEELQLISEHQARAVYQQLYITGPRFDRIDSDRLQELIIDCGVNHGTRGATKWLQAAAGVTRDGDLGPISQAAVNCQDSQRLFLLIIAHRIRLFGRLVSADKELSRAKINGYQLQAIFAAGWNSRAAEFLEKEAARQ